MPLSMVPLTPSSVTRLPMPRLLTSGLCAALLSGAFVSAPLPAQQPASFPSSWDPKIMQRADIKAAIERIKEQIQNIE